jgi:DNA-binding transcriptional ArsR family regulator
MVKYKPGSLDAVFAALSDPVRRRILERLAHGEASVGDLAAPFKITAPAISRHLRVLERAGLISREVDAQWRLCRLRAPALRLAHDWLQRYREHWDENLDRLTEYVEAQHNPPPRNPRRNRR